MLVMSTTDKVHDDNVPIKDTNELLAGLAKNVTQIVSNTGTIEKMAKAGIKIDQKLQVSNAEYIESLFETRKAKALETIKKFPPPPKIALPPITSLYDEIRECILFGLNGAAISLSAILVEFSLKHAIVDRTKGVETYDKDEWDRLENKELGPVIKEVEQLDLLDTDSIAQLRRFKNEVRNMYLHYNIKKITTGAVMEQAVRYDMESGKIVTEYNLKAEDHPFLWQMSKQKVDEQSVMNIFLFADSLVKRLFKAART
jgi:hypothetical protein